MLTNSFTNAVPAQMCDNVVGMATGATIRSNHHSLGDTGGVTESTITDTAEESTIKANHANTKLLVQMASTRAAATALTTAIMCWAASVKFRANPPQRSTVSTCPAKRQVCRNDCAAAREWAGVSRDVTWHTTRRTENMSKSNEEHIKTVFNAYQDVPGGMLDTVLTWS